MLWIVTEILHRSGKNEESRSRVSVASVLRRIDTPSILFFLGILLAVAALQTAGHLDVLAKAMDDQVGNLYVVNVIIGLLSAVIDNVPLVAGAMGMYQQAFSHRPLFLGNAGLLRRNGGKHPHHRISGRSGRDGYGKD